MNERGKWTHADPWIDTNIGCETLAQQAAARPTLKAALEARGIPTGKTTRVRWQIDKLRAFVGDSRDYDYVSEPKGLARDLLDALEMIHRMRTHYVGGHEIAAFLAAHGMEYEQ